MGFYGYGAPPVSGSTGPTIPAPGPTSAPPSSDSGGGIMDWLKNWFKGISPGDVIGAVGSGVGGYLDYDAKQKALAQQKAQFEALLKQRQEEYDRTTGNSEAQQAVQAETRLNRAPMADKAQALLMQRMGTAPTAFHPRDITQGANTLRMPATGGPADQLAAGQKAAAGYTPGQGGVNTEVLKLLLAKMRGSAFPNNAPQVPGVVPGRLPPPITTPGTW